jgi:hypothetical protein
MNEDAHLESDYEDRYYLADDDDELLPIEDDWDGSDFDLNDFEMSQGLA